MAFVLPLQSATCDNNTEDDYYQEDNRQNAVSTRSVFTDPALTFVVKKAERVGRSLVIDFQVTNNTKQTLRNVEFGFGGGFGEITNFYDYPTDNQGDYYNYIVMGFGNVMHADSRQIESLGSTPVIGHIVLPLFSQEEKVKKINVSALVSCSNYKFKGTYDLGILRMHDINIVDNRKSVWSPDRTLTFEANEWRNANNGYDDIVLSFTVRNNCDEPLNDLHLSIGGGSSGDSYGITDSNGVHFWGFVWRTLVEDNGWKHDEQIYRRDMRVEGGEWIPDGLDLPLKAGESKRCEVIVHDYNGSNRLNMTLGCSTSKRLLEDGYAYFVDTPVYK